MSERGQGVFLSYASQDAGDVRRIADALRAVGVEVWFDQSELVGGDAWDAKIRQQIKECVLFVPVISANTQARREGYFRIEWKLAAQRTHAIADGTPFLLPILIDETIEGDALVPEEFRSVQWTRLPIRDAQGDQGGEAMQRFCERVEKVRGGIDRVAAARGGERGSSFQLAKSPPARRRFPATIWLAAGIGGLALAVSAFLVLRPSGPVPTPKDAMGSRAPAAEKSAAPLTEAQKLVAQARRIYDEGDELNRENLFLAEELVKRALALDPAEAGAWELGGWLSYVMAWHDIDDSETRRQTMERQAARARALSPDSVFGQIVQYNARMLRNWTSAELGQKEDLPEIIRELQALAVREPRNWQVYRALGMAQRFLGQPAESIAALQRAFELSGGNPMSSADLINVLIRQKRHGEAETIVASSLARRPSGRLLTFDLLLKNRWRGDPQAGHAALQTWPAWLLREDRGAFLAWQSYYWGKRPDQALLVGQRMLRDYLNDSFFTGPRAVLTAQAHELAGQREAARADWRVAMQVVDRELAATPDDVAALYWKAWALARLGETDRAQAICTLLQQRNAARRAVFFKATNLAPLLVVAGLKDAALAELRAHFAAPNDALAITRGVLELDPAYEPLRADPAFQEILKVALAPEPVPKALTKQ